MKFVLVSACLIGIDCRYDGGNNANQDILALMNRNDICLIPICPEQMGGLPTPRIPSERKDGSVFNQLGENVTEYYKKGAEQALKIAKRYHVCAALLKERSPSCGCKKIYDGSFSHCLTDGYGVTSELLQKNNIKIFGESQVDKLIVYLNRV